VAKGLNTEKIELLRFKITEILKLYGAQVPRVLIMMTDVQLTDKDTEKFKEFLSVIRSTTLTPFKGIKILTGSNIVVKLLLELPDFKKIEVTSDIAEAMDKLGAVAARTTDGGLKGEHLQAGRAAGKTDDNIQLRMESDEEKQPSQLGAYKWESNLSIAVVDDDPVIRQLVKTTFAEVGGTVKEYENGRFFVDDLTGELPHLILLDLNMPEMDGFAVLSTLKDRELSIPVIILSASSQRETVAKAIGFGVRSYLIKPLKPFRIVQKTAEALQMNF
jgi:CheY-like chemotaxis protein